MNQQFHVVMLGRNVTVRLPLAPGQKYDSKTLIHPDHESRQFLEPLGPFAMASIDDQAKAQQILSEGFTFDDGSKWYVGGGFVRDDGAVFCLLPEKKTDKEFYRSLGMNVVLDKWADSFKVGKYIKRLWSHHREYIQGDVIGQNGDVLLVRLDKEFGGKVISVRYAPKSPLTEGMNLVSKHFLKSIGHKANAGTGLRITALSPMGFSKGHAIVMDSLHFDLVMFETKNMLTSNGRFTFALDELHPGKLFTDPQSVMNFRLDQGPFLERWAESFGYDVIEAIQDEDKLRAMLRFYNIGFHKWQKDEPLHGGKQGEYIFKEKDWALLRALRSGISIIDKPALVRKIFHLFLDKVMDCENNIRIPISDEVGGARYILVDPTIFDADGNPSKEGVLRGNEVYCPGYIGPVVFHRQPNAHRTEHHVANSVHHAAHIAIDEGSFMFISKDVVISTLLKLGGGDQDDRVVYYKDKEVVDHFNNLEAYPIVMQEPKPEPIVRKNRFSHELLRPKPIYDRDQIGIMLAQQKQQRVSIGQAVNPIMLDTVITDHQNEIINYMQGLPDEHKTAKVKHAIEEMIKFEGNRLKGVASQLEKIIDAVKRDGADVSVVATDIRDFWGWLPVVPEFCIHGGEFDGRLPSSRRGENLPVIVQTNVDVVLNKIADMREELEDFVTELSWQLVKEVPLEILTYPDQPGDLQLAMAMRTFYHQERERLMSPLDATDSKARIQAFIQVDQNVFDQFKHHPLVLEAMLKLYAMIYSARRPESKKDVVTGRPKAFPDGILWGPRLGGLMIQALDRAELTTRFVEAEMYDDMKRYKRDVHDITVSDGVMRIAGTETELGMVDRVPDGDTKLVRGLVPTPTGMVIPQPEVRVNVFTVVAGWTTRADATPEAIGKWRAHLCDSVQLVPYVYVDEKTTEPSHAVRVLLQDGTEYGHISAREAVRVTVPTMGWLTPGKTPKTMTVTVKESY